MIFCNLFFWVSGSTENPDDNQLSALSWTSLEQTRIMESFGQVLDKLQLSSELLENHQRSKPLEKRPLISQMNMIALVFSDFARYIRGYTNNAIQDSKELNSLTRLLDK